MCMFVHVLTLPCSIRAVRRAAVSLSMRTLEMKRGERVSEEKKREKESKGEKGKEEQE